MPAGAVCCARVNRYSPMPSFISIWGEVSTCFSSLPLYALMSTQNGAGHPTLFAQTTLQPMSRS